MCEDFGCKRVNLRVNGTQKSSGSFVYWNVRKVRSFAVFVDHGNTEYHRTTERVQLVRGMLSDYSPSWFTSTSLLHSSHSCSTLKGNFKAK